MTGSQFSIRGFALVQAAHTDLFGFGHYAKVESGVSGLLHIGQNVDVGFDADSAVMAQATSVNLHDHISNRTQHSPFDMFEALFLRRALRDLHLS